MTGTTSRSVTALLTVIVLLAACGAASTAPSPPTAPLVTATPPAQTPRPTTTPPTRVPTATTVMVDSVAVTVVDGVRVRSQPRISDDSYLEKPLLPLGTQLYVLDGPVSASGYTWYQVAPLTSRSLPTGWVASTGRDGEPWIAAGSFDCPPPPTDFRSLVALPPGVGLACFPQEPITLQARWVALDCDIDGAWHTPSWFDGLSGVGLVEPAQTKGTGCDTFPLVGDPTGEYPLREPWGDVVQVTGIFDHPAAASCTRTEMDGEPVPTQECRLEFAVTRLATVRP